MNALISRELRRRSLQGVFSMYLAMKLSLTSSFSPNRTTFVIPTQPSVSWLRQSYFPNRDLLFFRERTSFEVTSRLLNIALRAFIQTEDYAGVYVVLRTFGIFRLPVSTKTYLIVTRHIIKRLRWDISKAYKVEEPRWGNLFLGIPEVWALHKLNKQSDRELVEKILASAAWSDFPLTGPLLGYTSEDEKVAYTTPTTAMINGEAVVPERMRFHLLPLQRIIRRAILASAAVDSDDLPAAKRVSRAIVEAKAQMFPGTEHPYTTND
ncbi:hypothetical protein Hypma_012644 [Hypsizygus marmoreus]|uniref:Uncharacterized protein n=1 Tax=Hypsizygus marmoreus TaxID=39966 RepID=A0A369JEB0_HYPMA|nr:hypothetical protein Hypma_012644 [Hypsizygus marmoreus]